MPYYSKPSAEKSALQRDCNGEKLEFQPFGFAYNRPFIQEMLREQMGFEGYINSDTGIVHNMSWGVEMLDIPERIGFAVNHAGVDLISGLYDNEAGMEHISRGILPGVDTVILVSDCSRRGIQAVGRIARLVPECGLKPKKIGLIVNRALREY